jgi:RNA polymerase sigma-70 factor, ECF subfamily
MRHESVRRAQEGDHEAFAAIVRDALPRLYGTARLIVRDPSLAEESVQEALLEAWRDLRGLRDVDRLDAWLHRILVRTCFRSARRYRQRAVREIPLDPGFDAVSTDAAPPVADRDSLERAFHRLTRDERTVLALVYFADMTLADASVSMGIPLGTTKSRLHHALKALRAALAADDRPLQALDRQMT